MTDVPLTKIVDDHHSEVTRRLERIESKIDDQAKHTHPDLASWARIIPMGLTLVGLLVGLIIAV